MPETKAITYMWLKVDMPLYTALITVKRVVLIMYEAPICRDYSAFVSPLSSRDTTNNRQIRSFWLCLGEPLNINCGQVPEETDSAKQHGSHEMIFIRDSVISMTIANIF